MVYLQTHKRYIKLLRNDFGGHFGYKADRHAVENLNRDTSGALELSRKPLAQTAGPKLGFAGELVATAMTRHKGDKTSKQHFHHMITAAVEGYEHCTNCVHLVVRFYLIKRFSGPSWG